MEIAEFGPPYGELPLERALIQITSKGIPKLKNPKWSYEFQDFLNLCFITPYHKRPLAGELLNHKFLLVSCQQDNFIAQLKSALES